MNLRPGLLLDRDGIINERIVDGYVEHPDQLVIIPAILPVLRWAFDYRIPVAVVTNQQGVGKGLMTEADLDIVHAAMHQAISEQLGRTVDAVYECTSLESDGDDRRKPKPGMLLEAMEDFHMEPRATWIIGDSLTDAQAGRAAGTRTMLVGDFDQHMADVVVPTHQDILQKIAIFAYPFSN